jgi:hypothetical protein
VFVPALSPVTIAELVVDDDSVPDMAIQLPVPVVGWFAESVAELEQIV